MLRDGYLYRGVKTTWRTTASRLSAGLPAGLPAEAGDFDVADETRSR